MNITSHKSVRAGQGDAACRRKGNKTLANGVRLGIWSRKRGQAHILARTAGGGKIVAWQGGHGVSHPELRSANTALGPVSDRAPSFDRRSPAGGDVSPAEET